MYVVGGGGFSVSKCLPEVMAWAHLSFVSIRVLEGWGPMAVHPGSEHRVARLCVPLRQPLQTTRLFLTRRINPKYWLATPPIAAQATDICSTGTYTVTKHAVGVSLFPA